MTQLVSMDLPTVRLLDDSYDYQTRFLKDECSQPPLFDPSGIGAEPFRSRTGQNKPKEALKTLDLILKRVPDIVRVAFIDRSLFEKHQSKIDALYAIVEHIQGRTAKKVKQHKTLLITCADIYEQRVNSRAQKITAKIESSRFETIEYLLENKLEIKKERVEAEELLQELEQITPSPAAKTNKSAFDNAKKILKYRISTKIYRWEVDSQLVKTGEFKERILSDKCRELSIQQANGLRRTCAELDSQYCQAVDSRFYRITHLENIKLAIDIFRLDLLTNEICRLANQHLQSTQA